MQDAVRALLLLTFAGCLMTAVGSGAAWWLNEERRIRRYLRRALEAQPQSVIVARGYGRAAGLNLEAGRVAVLWDGGVKGLVYRLRQLTGAELIIDGQVMGRAHRGETRRALDQAPSTAIRVTLRLVFDNARDPDFELDLWPPGDPARRERGSAAEAISDGRRWLSGVEAILRQPDEAPPSAAIARDDDQDPEDPDEDDWGKGFDDDADDDPPWRIEPV